MKSGFLTHFFFSLMIIMCALTRINPAFSAHSTVPENPAMPRTFNAETFRLENGMQVIVVPNTLAPVVTHMLWIRAGAADEPESVAGAAHYLEHLMFKGTPHQKPGEYSRRIRALGGQDNAFTHHDYTAYYFTVTADHLSDIMAMERERFMHLAPPKDDITSEKQVILEERRERTDNDPIGAFIEQMNAYLFASHPYNKPIIGWMADMKRLTWDDAIAFKNKWYVPNNMVLIISGDVTTAHVRKLAQKYYSDWKTGPLPPRDRLSPPLHPGTVTLNFTSPKIQQPQVIMAWRVPPYRVNPKHARIIDMMVATLDAGPSTPLYQDLVTQKKHATSVNLTYNGNQLDEGALWLSATPADGVALTNLRQDLVDFLDKMAKNITDTDVQLAIRRRQHEAIYARDSVTGPAMLIGQGLMSGMTLDDIETWPSQIADVTAADIRSAITSFLRCNASETCQPPLTAYIDVDPALPVPPISVQPPVTIPNAGALK